MNTEIFQERLVDSGIAVRSMCKKSPWVTTSEEDDASWLVFCEVFRWYSEVGIVLSSLTEFRYDPMRKSPKFPLPERALQETS